MSNRIRILVGIVGMAAVVSGCANTWTGQVKSGDAGYKIACSMANARGTEVSGETPSYQSMQRRQERERAEAERRQHYEEDRELASTRATATSRADA